LGRGLGFEEAGLVLSELAGLQLEDIEVRQSAMARFTRLGFKAAAVTAFSVTLERMALPSDSGITRHAELRFGHPFAVVAVADDDTWNPSTRSFVRGPWHQVPVFSAWITDPMDDEDVPDAEELNSRADNDPRYDHHDIGRQTWLARIRASFTKLRDQG
jgi:hypothetical protein